MAQCVHRTANNIFAHTKNLGIRTSAESAFQKDSDAPNLSPHFPRDGQETKSIPGPSFFPHHVFTFLTM